MSILVGTPTWAAFTGADRFEGVAAATICVWYKSSGGHGGSDDHILNLRDNTTQAGMAFKVETASPADTFVANISAVGGSSAYTDTKTTTARGQTDWHFLALVYDSADPDNAFFMIDNDVIFPDGASSSGLVQNNNHDFNVGFFNGLGSGFHASGNYSNAMAFQTALTIDELRALRWNPEAYVGAGFSNISHLRGYDDKIDYGDHANAVTWANVLTNETGSEVNAPTLLDGATASHDFDGSTDRLTFDVSADPVSTLNEYTVFCWNNDDVGNIDAWLVGSTLSLTAFALIAENSSGTPYAPRFVGRSSGSGFGSWDLIGVGLADASGTWHAMAGVIDLGATDGIKLIVDGVEIATDTIGGTGMLDSGDDIHIGDRLPAGSSQFNGKIAHVAGVKGVLTLAEITEIQHKPDLLLERTDLHFYIALDHNGYRDLGPNAFDVDIATTRPSQSTEGPPTQFGDSGMDDEVHIDPGARAMWDPSFNDVKYSQDGLVARADTTTAPVERIKPTISDGQKIIFEVFVDERQQDARIGVTEAPAPSSVSPGNSLVSWAFENDANKVTNSIKSAYGTTQTDDDIVSVAVDFDLGAIWFGKNGVWQNGATDAELAAGTVTNAAFSGLTFGAPLYGVFQTNGGGAHDSSYVLLPGPETRIAIPSGWTTLETDTRYAGWSATDPGWRRWQSSDGDFSTAGPYSHLAAAVFGDNRTASGVWPAQASTTGRWTKTGTTIPGNSGGGAKVYCELELLTDPGPALQQRYAGFVPQTSDNSAVTSSILSGLDGVILQYDDQNSTFQEGNVRNDGSAIAITATLNYLSVVGDYVMFAIDTTVSPAKVWVGLNGTWEGGGDPAAGTGESATTADAGEDLVFGAQVKEDHIMTTILRAQTSEFNQAAPSGFSGLPVAVLHTGAGLMPMTMAIAAVGLNNIHRGDGLMPMTMAIAATGHTAHHGAGLVPMTMAITAVGLNSVHHGVGALPMTMAIAAVGDNAVHHGVGVPAMTMTIAAIGQNNLHTGVGVPAMTMAIAATGSNDTKHGNAVPAMTMAIVATGSNPAKHGDGLMPMTMAIAATGSNPAKHGDAVPAMTMAIVATGSNDIHRGDGLMPMTMAISATGQTNANGLGGTVTLPALTVDGIILAGATAVGTLTLPIMTHNGTIVRGNAGVANLTIPLLGVTGTLVATAAYQGNPRMPQLQINGLINNETNEVSLPTLTVNGIICNGPVLVSQVTLPFLQVTGSILNPNLSTGSVSPRALQVTGTIITGSVITGSINLPGLQVLSLLDGDNLISGTLTLPSFRTDPAQAPLAAGSLGEGLVILPFLRVNGTIVNTAVLASTVWAMNTESFETTNYLNFDFINLVSFNDQPYGVTDAGIFLLAGDDDDGTNIDAEFLSGIEDRDDAHLKEADGLYMAYTGGNLVLRLFPDGQTRVREYPVERISNSTGVKHARFKGARGLRSRTYQLGIKNQGGSEFKIDKMGLLLRILSRKTRKN
jgi:hypothetical protein